MPIIPCKSGQGVQAQDTPVLMWDIYRTRLSVEHGLGFDRHIAVPCTFPLGPPIHDWVWTERLVAGSADDAIQQSLSVGGDDA